MRLLTLFSILFFIISCTQKVEQSVEIISVNPGQSDSVSLSKIASGVEKILLETKEASFITRIQEIERTKQFIFVNDAGRRILQFDSSGKFLRQIGSAGRGPGEYMGINNIALDSVNSILYISAFKQILAFDFSGRLINEIKQGAVSEFMTVSGDKILTVSTSFGIKSNENKYLNITKLIRYTLQGIPLDTIIIKKIELPGIFGTTFPQAYYLSDLGNTLYLYYPVLIPEPSQILRDTLYELKEHKMISSVKLDFGKASVPKNGKKQIQILNIYRTVNYLISEYSFEGDKLFFYHDYIRNVGYNIRGGLIDDFFNTGVVQLRPLDLRSELMYFVKDAFEVTGKIEEVSENSNPVIFFVKLK